RYALAAAGGADAHGGGGAAVLRRLDDDELVAPHPGLAVGDGPRLGVVHHQGLRPGIDDHEVIAQSVHLDEGAPAHGRVIRLRRQTSPPSRPPAAGVPPGPLPKAAGGSPCRIRLGPWAGDGIRMEPLPPGAPPDPAGGDGSRIFRPPTALSDRFETVSDGSNPPHVISLKMNNYFSMHGVVLQN